VRSTRHVEFSNGSKDGQDLCACLRRTRGDGCAPRRSRPPPAAPCPATRGMRKQRTKTTRMRGGHTLKRAERTRAAPPNGGRGRARDFTLGADHLGEVQYARDKHRGGVPQLRRPAAPHVPLLRAKMSPASGTSCAALQTRRMTPDAAVLCAARWLCARERAGLLRGGDLGLPRSPKPRVVVVARARPPWSAPKHAARGAAVSSGFASTLLLV